MSTPQLKHTRSMCMHSWPWWRYELAKGHSSSTFYWGQQWSKKKGIQPTFSHFVSIISICGSSSFKQVIKSVLCPLSCCLSLQSLTSSYLLPARTVWQKSNVSRKNMALKTRATRFQPSYCFIMFVLYGLN